LFRRAGGTHGRQCFLRAADLFVQAGRLGQRVRQYRVQAMAFRQPGGLVHQATAAVHLACRQVHACRHRQHDQAHRLRGRRSHRLVDRGTGRGLRLVQFALVQQGAHQFQHQPGVQPFVLRT
jgi:hypothetical protein